MKIIPLAIPTPFYIGEVNVFLVKAEPLTLVDAGADTDEAFAVLDRKLRAEGVRLADIERILLTHAHEDHSGLARRVADAAKNAQIFVHRWESAPLAGESNVAAYRALMRRAGTPDRVFDRLQTIFENASRRAETLRADEFAELTDEMEIEFAGGALEVVHTPGHTPGSCSFFRPANRTVIAGDTILKRLTPNPIIAPDPFDANKRFASLAEYLVSLARIRTLAPTLVYGGHGEPIEDYEEIFARYVRQIDERQRKIVALVPDLGATAFEIAQTLFPDAVGAGFHEFLAVSETVAHLDYAVAENKIAVELTDDREFYRKL